MRQRTNGRVFAWVLTLALAALTACSAYTRHLERGDGYLGGKQWQLAKDEYERAIALEPNNPEAQARLSALKEAWATEFILQADHQRAGKELAEAAQGYLHALEVDPGNPTATRRLEETLEEWVKVGRLEIANRRFAQAIQQFEAILRLSPRHAQALAAREEARFGLAHEYFQVAENFERQGKFGNALVEYVRADEVRVGATPARERAELMRRKLIDSIAYYVVVEPVSDKAGSPDVASRFTAGRLGAMGQRLPMRFVTAAPSNVLGLKVKLQLDRVLYSRDKELTQKLQKYVAGTRSIPNVKRTQAEGELLSAERALEDVESDATAAQRAYLESTRDLERAQSLLERCRTEAFAKCQRAVALCREAAAAPAEQRDEGRIADCQAAGCGAEACASDERLTADFKDATGAARARMAEGLSSLKRQRKEVQRLRDTVFRTPITVDEPFHADFVYDVELHKAAVRASVTLWLQSLTAENQAPSPITHDYLVTHEDTTHRGFDKYGVFADPLQVKSETELRLAAGDAVLVDVFKRVRSRFENYRQALLADARRSVVRAGAEDAVEATVRAILASPDAPPKDLMAALGRARQVKKPEGLLAL